jgi:hypothetical protein
MARLGGAYCAAVSVPAQLERGIGQARRAWLDGHGQVKDTRVPPGRREMATLGQRVNFAGVSSDRRVKAQTAAW